MRVSPTLVILGSLLAASPVPALADPAGPPPDAGPPPPWVVVVRRRVVAAVATVRHIPRGRVVVGFTVTETGEIVGVHVEGPPRIAPRVTAALLALGRVPPPPDDHFHKVSVAVRYH